MTRNGSGLVRECLGGPLIAFVFCDQHRILLRNGKVIIEEI